MYICTYTHIRIAEQTIFFKNQFNSVCRLLDITDKPWKNRIQFFSDHSNNDQNDFFYMSGEDTTRKTHRNKSLGMNYE